MYLYEAGNLDQRAHYTVPAPPINQGGSEWFTIPVSLVELNGFSPGGNTQIAVGMPTSAPEGATGVTGVTGATGPTGGTGSQGVTGVTGVAGATGVSGVKGTTGSTGPTGVGTVGATGVTGVSGTAGAVGATGPSGSAGSVGATGVVGATGPVGATGVQGPAGATGSTGPSGASGAGGAGTDEVWISDTTPVTPTSLELWYDPSGADPVFGGGITQADADLRYVNVTGDSMPTADYEA